MTLTLSNGKVLRNDFIISLIVRNDLAPIPESIEAKIRLDEAIKPLLKEGAIVETQAGHKHRIIKCEQAQTTAMQGERPIGYIAIIAILDDCHKLSFVREQGKAIGKENASLSACYRACGATIKAVSGDFPIPRFNCFVGDTPTFAIARVLQESGGVVRIKNNKLSFLPLRSFASIKPLTITESINEAVASGMKGRHEVPNFISINPDASLIKTTSQTARTVDFSPHKNSIMLGNMTRHLALVQKSRLPLTQTICAGDVVTTDGINNVIVITAAHTFMSGTDGQSQQSYTLLWLSEVRE
jgi:hypothetical protein